MMNRAIPKATAAAMVLASIFLLTAAAPGEAAKAATSAGSAAYHYSIGTKLALDGAFPEAAREYEKALQLDPKSTFLSTELATLYVKMGDLDRALAVCEQSLAQNPDNAETYGIMGGIYLFKKDYEKAIGAYQRVIAIDPKSQDTYLYLSVIYAEMKRYDEAIQTLQALLRQDPR